jgi:hypothetical protein
MTDPYCSEGEQMRLARTLGLAAGLAMVGSMALAGGASAEPIERGKFHDEGTFIDHDFCEVAGLDVQGDFVFDNHFLVNPHGPDGLIYFHENYHLTIVFTNLANPANPANTVTSVERAIRKDLRVTDNGDGTLTILELATGNATLYGPDGKAIGRNPGQVRFEFDVDHAGTPTDPSDDVFVEERMVKGSTGRSDDFCETAVPALEA